MEANTSAVFTFSCQRTRFMFGELLQVRGKQPLNKFSSIGSQYYQHSVGNVLWTHTNKIWKQIKDFFVVGTVISAVCLVFLDYYNCIPLCYARWTRTCFRLSQHPGYTTMDDKKNSSRTLVHTQMGVTEWTCAIKTNVTQRPLCSHWGQLLWLRMT